MPQTGVQTQRAQLSSLASQFGVDVGGAAVSQGPAFYAELIRSREVLRQVASSNFVVADSVGFMAHGTLRGNLADVLGFEHDNAQVALAEAVDWLQDESLSVSAGGETGIVALSVQTHWPELSEDLARRIVSAVNSFNLEIRQTQAAAEREFVQERVEAAQADLHAAEDSLQAFLQRNRAFENSPELSFNYERLQRRVSLAQQIYGSLAQSYEQARIAEVRNTAVITPIEHPIKPVRPDSVQLLLKLVLGAVIGALLAISAGLAVYYLQKDDIERQSEMDELKSQWEETKADLKLLLRRQ